MAKTYVDVVKYVIETEFEIKGVVDKPDIIGAVFGQSEGLIGEDMDLRELQNSGKIGRIEIKMDSMNGKTIGMLSVPSAMDTVQTSLLAAAIEAVDKVGPFEARFNTKGIQDVRNTKRKEIAERAKQLLMQLSDSLPESQELAEQVRSNVRTAELSEYGPEKLPCGPDIASEDSVIIVEGRADVLNLLRHGIKNVIAMGGSNITPGIIELCRRKTVTLFMDGDRGGELNLRRLEQLAKVDFVARAPDGKEVEELARKEIIMALRKKESLESYNSGKHFLRATIPGNRFSGELRDRFHSEERRPHSMNRNRMRPNPRFLDRPDRPRFGRDDGYARTRSRFDSPMMERRPRMDYRPMESHREPMEIAPRVPPTESNAFKEVMESLKGSLKAKLLDASGSPLKEVAVRDLVKGLKEIQGIQTIVFDGVITKRLVEAAKKAGVQTIVGVRKGKLDKLEGVHVVTTES